MITNKDSNYEFSDNVVVAMMQTLSDPNLGMDTLEESVEFSAVYATTVIKCMTLVADTWYYPNSGPRTILYAILINTVHEYLLDNEDKYNNPKFWVDLLCNATKIWNEIDEIVENIKNNDKINIDNYHGTFRGELNASTQ